MTGARIVPRYQRVTLAAPYADVWLDVRINPPMRVFDDFASGDLKRLRPALASLIQASNLENDDGTPIDLSADAGWDAVPPDFLAAVAAGLTEAINPKASPEKLSSGDSSPTAPDAPPTSTP